MLAKGYNINDIAEITGLGLEEIKALSSISGDLPTLK